VRRVEFRFESVHSWANDSTVAAYHMMPLCCMMQQQFHLPSNQPCQLIECQTDRQTDRQTDMHVVLPAPTWHLRSHAAACRRRLACCMPSTLLLSWNLYADPARQLGRHAPCACRRARQARQLCGLAAWQGLGEESRVLFLLLLSGVLPGVTWARPHPELAHAINSTCRRRFALSSRPYAVGIAAAR
jgi:hypothetical protein